MRTRSIRGYLMQSHLRISAILIAAIFVLSISAMFLTVHLQSAGHAAENAEVLRRSVERFWEAYEQQGKTLNRSQSIRTYLAYAAQGGMEDAETAPPELPGGVALYDLGRQIYPATRYPAALPETAQTRQTFVHTLSETQIGYFTPFYNFTGSEVLGYLCFPVPLESLSRSVRQAMPETVGYQVCDSEGRVLLDVQRGYRYVREAAHDTQGTAMACTASVDMESGYQSVLLLLLCLIPISVFVFAVSAVFSRRIAGRLIQPINSLIASIKRNEMGDLGYVSIYESELEEIDLLSRSYQSLMARIGELMDKNQKENLLRIESELDVLQEKINPHFLFNTLELISSQAILEDADQTAVLTQKLGTLFRYNLRAPDVIPLKRELQYAKDYLYLQNVRFNHLIRCEYRVDDRLLRQPVPKLTLQPLLENCFQHGFADSSNQPHQIDLTIFAQAELLRIWIDDDGAGMPPEQLAQLEAALRQDAENFAHFIQRREHIGLRNVHARLCLQYHIGKAIWLSRSPLGGVRVEICIPRMEEEKGGDGPCCV